MLLPRALLVPHLPTLVLDQHRGHDTAMLRAFAAAAARLAEGRPEVVVALSARWDAPGPFRVDDGRRHRTLTDYSGLGVEVRYDCDGHPAVARALIDGGAAARLPVGGQQRGVDSGITVPMHLLVPARDVPVVPLSLPARTAEECRAWGAVVRRVLAARPERAAFVVSGLLSANLHAWGLKREVAETSELDRLALQALTRGAFDRLVGLPAELLERAQPEAALRHLQVLRGFLGEGRVGEVLCYEDGPGVGSALVEFTLETPAPDPAASTPAEPAHGGGG
jgi:aromatic ring-opening dioxygenase catalytic subunit (LigB family)